tara:strand:- start:1607 stop:2023 length:417 start_codon:yes stop_codon:yes gene_type:complete
MGFKIPITDEITLDFSETSEDAGDGIEAMADAVIVCRSQTSAQMEDFDAYVQAEPGEGEPGPIEQRVGWWMAEKIIIRWNLEDEHGDALPITGESFRHFPSWVALYIRGAYNRGVITPPSFLDERSKNGVAAGVPSTL